MKVKKYELVRIIDKLKSVVQKNTVHPALGGVLVKEGYLIAANGEITIGGFMDWNIERSYEECSPIGEVKIVLEEVFVLRKNRNVKSRTIEVKIQ